MVYELNGLKEAERKIVEGDEIEEYNLRYHTFPGHKGLQQTESNN